MTNAERLRELLNATKNGRPAHSGESYSLVEGDRDLELISRGEAIVLTRERVESIVAELEDKTRKD